MTYILQTNHVTKSIGKKELVRDVNIHIKKGEIYGFLGPNGAGKTTVMKMITNLWKPTEGEIEIFGEKLTPTSYGVLKRMGSIIEFPTFYETMSGYDNLVPVSYTHLKSSTSHIGKEQYGKTFFHKDMPMIMAAANLPYAATAAESNPADFIKKAAKAREYASRFGKMCIRDRRYADCTSSLTSSFFWLNFRRQSL